MRLVPQSLFGRLLAIALLSSAAALAFAGVTIGGVLERFVMHGLDDRLDAQVHILARAVRPDGTLDRTRAIDLPGFHADGSGWSWQVRDAAGRSWGSSPAAPIAEPPPPVARDGPGRGPRPGEGRGRHGERLHFRTMTVVTPAGPVAIAASGPRRIVAAPLREAMVPLLLSLAILGLGLAAATLVQLRVGLRPLRRLQGALADVRAGRATHVPPDQPTELRPLAAELNALIDQNAAGLAHARQHVANLAHGLKTPLAALAVRLAEGGDPDGSLGAMVGRIDRRIRHHLGRARAATPGGSARVATPVAPAIADLLAALRRIHADRPRAVAVAVAPGLVVGIDPHDLDEMIGNLLDNAWRHARTAIRVDAEIADGAAILAIADDGPGLDPAVVAEALMPGRRLDERGDGHGFGLSIARELAELNGGRLDLSRDPVTGGLRARLELPIRSLDAGTA